MLKKVDVHPWSDVQRTGWNYGEVTWRRVGVNVKVGAGIRVVALRESPG